MTASLRSTLDDIIERNRRLLHKSIEDRRREMAHDNLEHYRLYEVLGLGSDEGSLIDLYQNIGRFVYKYAGALLEEASFVVLERTKSGRRIRIANSISSDPTTFEIDCYVEEDNKAHEIKWRDATTDGDHIKKEHNKILCIVEEGMIPVRVMYYMPNREQAIRIQERVISEYRKHGEAYVGRDAWNYICSYTGFDLHGYLFEKTKDAKL